VDQRGGAGGPADPGARFLLWLWITNLALLFGAELDAELERTRELQGYRGGVHAAAAATGHGCR
jgi:uncharacterized BrkB/YihY/UPF0761 family membrane protein